MSTSPFDDGDTNSTNGETQEAIAHEIARRVRNRAIERRFTARSFGTALGLASSTSSIYWKGERAWPTALLPKVAEQLDTSVQWLFTGGNANAIASSGDVDMVEIEQIDLAFGLGGRYTDVPVDRTMLQFPRAWIGSLTSTPASLLTFALGRGDSMSPTLQDSDIVLIDRSITRIYEEDAIWALTIGDIAMIKRLRVRGDKVHLLSDNERVPSDTVEIDEIVVVGRVIFIGRKI